LSIYVRPVREQLEHDRVIRHLQTKLKRKYDVAINIGAEQAASVKAGPQVLYPDLVLLTTDKGRKLAGVVEVETGESVHHLEAMAQWAPFGRLKVPFQLYVPVASADIARRLASDLGAHVTELWTYHAIGDQIRLTLVQKSPIPGEARRKADRERAAEKRASAARPRKAAARPAGKAAKTVARAARSVTRLAKSIGKAARSGAASPRPAGRKPAKSAKKTSRPAPRRK
jgi:hypothetical protein